ncbi:hypothetical protein MKX03_026933, partial [Papaver bracteatum]
MLSLIPDSLSSQTLAFGSSILNRETLPSLVSILTCSAGLDRIDLVECQRSGIVVGNTSVYSENVADLAVVLGRISANDGYVCAGLWDLSGDYSLGSKMSAKRVGLFELGR